MNRVQRLPVADLVITGTLLVIFGAAWLLAGDWPARAALFPRIVTGAAFVLGVVAFIAFVCRGDSEEVPTEPASPAGLAEEDADTSDLEYVFATSSGKLWAQTLGWVVFFFVSLYALGLYMTAPIFAIAYLRLAARASWTLAITYAAALVLVFYGGFGQLLAQPVPSGIFG